LSGGTALSEFYLHHRFSEDLDFFSEKEEAWPLLLDLFVLFGFWPPACSYTPGIFAVGGVALFQIT